MVVVINSLPKLLQLDHREQYLWPIANFEAHKSTSEGGVFQRWGKKKEKKNQSWPSRPKSSTGTRTISSLAFRTFIHLTLRYRYTQFFLYSHLRAQFTNNKSKNANIIHATFCVFFAPLLHTTKQYIFLTISTPLQSNPTTKQHQNTPSISNIVFWLVHTHTPFLFDLIHPLPRRAVSSFDVRWSRLVMYS